MDELLRILERSVSPADLARIRDIITNSPRPLSPRDLKFILAAIIAASNNPHALMQYLIALGRAGLLDARGIMLAIEEAQAILAAAAEAEAAAAAGGAGAVEGGAAAGGGAVAGGLTLAALLAILAAILAIAFAGWAIYEEANTGLYTPTGGVAPTAPPTGGPLCGTGPGGQVMARVIRTVSVWGWGSRSTLNKAIRQAESMCNALSANCTGTGCGPGLTCKPDVAVQSVASFNGILATRVVLTFTCPCVCK